MKVDIDKLRKVHADLGEVLGIEPFTVATVGDNKYYQKNQLSEKEELIFGYIKEHPGVTKEDVVRNVKDYSRVTVLNTIKRLVDDGLILDKEDKINSKRHFLFVNSNNELALLIIKLDSFEEAYLDLIDKLQLSDNVSKISFIDKSNLAEAIILPFKSLMLLMQYELFGHIEKAPNGDLVQKKVNTVYTRIQQIHLKLCENKALNELFAPMYSEEEILIHLFMNRSNGLSPENIIAILGTFKKFGMTEYVEKLIDSLWDISYPILHFVDLHYSRVKYDAVMIKDWRNIISEYDYSADKNRPLHIRR